MVNRYFSLTQLTTTASTYFDANGKASGSAKWIMSVLTESEKSVDLHSDGQFKTGIPEDLTKRYCFLKLFLVISYPVQHSTSQFIDILSQVSSINQRIAYRKPAVIFISLTTALDRLALPCLLQSDTK